MAKPPETDAPKKKRGPSVLAWVLMAMIIGGLGGFGVTNFGGGTQSIGTVGTREIDANDYARALKQEINAFSAQIGQPIGLPQAQALGLDRQVLQQVITRAAIDNENERIGISVGDAVVADQIAGMNAFHSTAGSFDRETYRQALQRNNMTESIFEAGLRSDLSRTILQGAVVGGFVAPKALVDTLYAYDGERRGYSLLRLREADLPAPLPAPFDADLKTYYDTNIAAFTRPEAKRITYAEVLPDDLAQTMPIDDKALQDAYNSRLSEFQIPEKRLVERLVFGTESEATAAKARLDAGETFEALVAERKLALDDVDLGDVSKPDLGAAGDAVFALASPGVVGPFMSDLGPALFRMNAILAAQNTTFEAAKPALLIELQTDAARRAIGDKVNAVDDALAGGGTIEDVAKEQGLKIATTDYASGADDNDPIAAYPAFRKAADKMAEGDYAEAVLLDDGGLVVLRVDSTIPATARPIEAVHDKLVEAWTAAALAKALGDHAAIVKAAVEGGASLGAYGIVSVATDADRRSFVEGAPPSLMQAVFAMKPGDLQVIEGPGFTALLRLDTITAAPVDGDAAKAERETLATGAQQAIASDAFTLYSNALTSEAGITLDQAVINAVHAQFR